MGVDYFSHVFIGRKCTIEEIKASLKKIENLNGDWDLFDPEDPLECLESEDGYSIFAFHYGACYEEDPFANIEDCQWFVIAEYIKKVSNGDSIPIHQINSIKFDGRYELFVLNDIS